MEEMLGNVAGARQISERWMAWQPDQQGWLSYIKFELQYNEIDRARPIFERFMLCDPKVSAWIRFAKFEMRTGRLVGLGTVMRGQWRSWRMMKRRRHCLLLLQSLRRGARRQRGHGVYTSLHRIPKGRAEDLYRKLWHLRGSLGIRKGLRMLLLARGGFSTRMRLRRTRLIMIRGSITFGWKRVWVGNRGLERFMSVQLPMFLRLQRSDIGSVTFICGLTMHCTKS